MPSFGTSNYVTCSPVVRGRRGVIFTWSRLQRRASRRTIRREDERRKSRDSTAERKRQLCARARARERERTIVGTHVCTLWSPVGLPFNRWLDSPTRSFIHTRGTRFESISKTRKRIFPVTFSVELASSAAPPTRPAFDVAARELQCKSRRA
jgi:hypothetical protein